MGVAFGVNKSRYRVDTAQYLLVATRKMARVEAVHAV